MQEVRFKAALDALSDPAKTTVILVTRPEPAPVPAPPTAAQGRLVKALRAQLVQRGASLGIAPEMLARRRDLEELVRWRADVASSDGLGLMRGWRRAVIGEELLRLTEGWVI